jgi:hypothetical protein
MKLLGIISVGFDVTDQPLIKSSADLWKNPRAPRYGNLLLRPTKPQWNIDKLHSILNTSVILLKTAELHKGDENPIYTLNISTS